MSTTTKWARAASKYHQDGAKALEQGAVAGRIHRLGRKCEGASALLLVVGFFLHFDVLLRAARLLGREVRWRCECKSLAGCTLQELELRALTQHKHLSVRTTGRSKGTKGIVRELKTTLFDPLDHVHEKPLRAPRHSNASLRGYVVSYLFVLHKLTDAGVGQNTFDRHCSKIRKIFVILHFGA
jgi:hypothetical protein